MSVGSEQRPDDLLPIQILLTARFSGGQASQTAVIAYVVSNQDGEQLGAGTIDDDGVFPDSAALDGVVRKFAQFTMKRVEIRPVMVETWAQTDQGLRSTSMMLPLTIVRANQPPVVSNLQAPDTVRLTSTTQVILLEIRATDPNGQTDITRVIFQSFRPDGSPSSGNPFFMYDDGGTLGSNSGDRVAGDGLFSRAISLPPNTGQGTYRFEFQAFDRSNAASNMITHYVTVRQ
ncbi:MAG TPA: hypothetical protein VNN76_07780 [Bacteroidota bacterium]|nr:hypothetical protein [Bacteroidota bacterium]